MKKLYMSFVVFIVCIRFAAYVTYADGPKRYPKVKSGIIKYNVTGMNEGTEVVYFDNWGEREARYSNTSINMMGVIRKNNTLTIMTDNGKWIYNIDLDKKTGTKMKNPTFDKLAGKSEKELEDLTEKMLGKMGAKKTGTEKVAGKTCDVWESQSVKTKTCIWNDITLKSEAGIGKMSMNLVATEVKEGVSIPDEKFQIPSDVKIQELDMSTVRGGWKPE